MSSFLVLSDGDTRNRWLDGQVCPDVGQGTMAPWARRLGCVLACYAQIGRGRSRDDGGRREDGKRERRGKETEKERGEGRRRKKREEREGDGKKRGKGVGERERGARLVWRKGLSPEIGVKKTMNAGGVENRIETDYTGLAYNLNLYYFINKLLANKKLLLFVY
ncbi:hypothetical protein TNCV_645851 [Trichonephila clavipes]|nr:hypothetical protein TNCV_645851 [Trichonephila clavipes]